MAAIVKSDEVQVTRTQYAVAGWGTGELWTSPRAVLAHDFSFDVSVEHDRSARASGARSHELVSIPHDDVDALGLAARFRAFLAGDSVSFEDVPLDLDELPPFHRALADVLRAVPRGEVVTYGELAALAGRPHAGRAAGTFCAANRFAFLLPCHRVVAAGRIGGYGSAGLGVKRRLLALEGVVL